MRVAKSIWLTKSQLNRLVKVLAKQYTTIRTTSRHELGRFRNGKDIVILYKNGTVYSPHGLERFREEIEDAVRSDYTHSGYELVVGQDETGKGELFGPMIIGSVALTQDQMVDLQLQGVKDSKKLKSDEIAHLSKSIQQQATATSFVTIGPKKFSALFTEFKAESKTLNDLLAWAHTKAMESTFTQLKEAEVKGRILVVIDEFGRQSIDRRLKTISDYDVTIRQIPHAEISSIAVAAASIIARYHRDKWLRDIENRLGMELSRVGIDDIIKRPELKEYVKLPYLETMQNKRRT